MAPEFNTEVIKAIGDAVMVRANEAPSSIRFALHVVEDVGDRHNFPTVRVGMHTGPIEHGADWIGRAVNLAARVSAEASGREVLLTDATRDAAGEIDGAEIRDRGRRSLRNVSEPVSHYAAVRQGTRQLTHEGTEYHFCS